MSKPQIIAALAVTAWIAYALGQRSACSCAKKPATAVAAVSQDTWDWLSAVGTM